MPPAGSLAAEQLSFFDAHGHLVLESFSSAEEVQAMRGRMAGLVDGFDGANSTVFSTKDHRQVKDDYFFKSAENISIFFEATAEPRDKERPCARVPEGFQRTVLLYGRLITILRSICAVC